jgi:hypothetical protein
MATPMFTGPVPPEGELWCTACVFVYKAAGIQALGEQLNRVAAEGDPAEEAWFDLIAVNDRNDTPQPKPAVCWGIFGPLGPPPFGTGVLPLPVPLCWSHAMGFVLKAGGVMPATQMPSGGAVMLGQPR